jgi:hypothetical protein
MLASEGGMNWQFNSDPLFLWTKTDLQAKKPLLLSADPSAALGAATKQYVDGKFSGAGYVLPVATGTVLGGVMIGTGLAITAAGVLSAAATALTPATTTVLGGIKVGSGLTVTVDGTLSAAGAVANSVNGSEAGLTLWIGSQAQFTAIATKDPKTLYNVVA